MPTRSSGVPALVATLALVAAACGGGTAPPELEPITFMAGFSPQANLPFVGAYVAKDLGYFAEEGLDVTIEHSAGGGEHLQLLAAGQVQVTTQDAAVLLQRRADPGLPLVAVALIGQKGQQGYVALADSGIETPEDWAGHRVGFKGTPPPDVFAILDAVGLSVNDIELVNVGFDPRVLTEGLVDVYPVFLSNEPNVLRGWGFELNVWDAADFGVPTLGLTYTATEQMVAEQPEVLAAFLRAAIRGIEYARQHPEEAIDIVMRYVGEGGDRNHQRFILETELAASVSAITQEHGTGWQTLEQWQALADMLVRYQALAEAIDVEAAFTTELLP